MSQKRCRIWRSGIRFLSDCEIVVVAPVRGTGAHAPGSIDVNTESTRFVQRVEPNPRTDKSNVRDRIMQVYVVELPTQNPFDEPAEWAGYAGRRLIRTPFDAFWNGYMMRFERNRRAFEKGQTMPMNSCESSRRFETQRSLKRQDD